MGWTVEGGYDLLDGANFDLRRLREEKKGNAKQIEEAMQSVPWLFAASESRKRWIVAEAQRRAEKEKESEAQPKQAEAQQKRRLDFQKITEDVAKKLKAEAAEREKKAEERKNELVKKAAVQRLNQSFEKDSKPMAKA